MRIRRSRVQLGLKGEFEGTRRWVKVSVQSSDSRYFGDESIDGVYTLLDGCDGPMGTLHKVPRVPQVELSTPRRLDPSTFLDPRSRNAVS